jgi:hypothetical protein
MAEDLSGHVSDVARGWKSVFEVIELSSMDLLKAQCKHVGMCKKLSNWAQCPFVRSGYY